MLGRTVDTSREAGLSRKVEVTVSCVVPAFNAARYIGETLDSVLAQTSPPDEVIVVDDGSTDGTLSVVERFGSAVRLLRRERGGAAAARNSGIEAAVGRFIALVDSDDLWHPEKIERQLGRFRQRPDLEISVTRFEDFWSPEAESRPVRRRTEGRPTPGYAIPTMLARKSVFDRVGPYDARRRVGENVDWWLRAAKAEVIVDLLPDVLVFRRLHSANTTRTAAGLIRDALFGLVKEELEYQRSEGESLLARLPGIRDALPAQATSPVRDAP